MAVPQWQPGLLYQPGDLVQPITAPPPTAAQVVNGDFSAGNANWDFTGGAEFTATGGYAGNGPCATMPGSVPDGLALNRTKLVVPTSGSTFEASALIQQGASIAGATRGWVEVQWFDAEDNFITSERGNVVSDGSGGEWKKSTITATRPAAAAYARAGIGLFSVADHNRPIWGDNLTVSGTFAGLPDGLIYRAVQAESGFSAASEPAWPPILGQQVTDNEVIWEAVASARVTWTASPLYVSGASEPGWPTDVDSMVRDGTINWRAVSRRVEDENCPNTKIVVIGASKVFCGDDDIVRYSATVNPLDWTTPDNAGYLPTGLQNYGANPVSAMGLYRGNLVVFNSEAFQLWQIDEDPANMALLDALPIGSTEHRSIAPVSNDLFFASSQGVRSLGIAASSTNFQAGDVGIPIDPLVKDAMRAARANGEHPLGLYYPAAGQYMLCFANYPPTALALSGNLPNGRVEDIGQHAYTAKGGVVPYRFSITSGDLPTGAQMSSAGVVSYEYSVPGVFSWEVTVIDALGTSISIADTATIRAQQVFAAASNGDYLIAGPDASGFDRQIDTGIAGALVESRLGRLFHIGVGVGRVSTDEGITFSQVTGLPAAPPAALIASQANWFYLPMANTAVGFRSADGFSFTPFIIAETAQSFFSAYSAPGILMFGAAGAVYRSTDGTMWAPVAIAGMGIVRAIAGNSQAIMAIDGNQAIGVFRRSVDAGLTWAPVASPDPAKIPTSIACSSAVFVVAFSDGTTGRSLDAGLTWQMGGRAGTSLGVNGPQNELVYAGKFLLASRDDNSGPAYPMVYSSIDGVAWAPIYTGGYTEVMSITPLRDG